MQIVIIEKPIEIEILSYRKELMMPMLVALMILGLIVLFKESRQEEQQDENRIVFSKEDFVIFDKAGKP